MGRRPRVFACGFAQVPSEPGVVSCHVGPLWELRGSLPATPGCHPPTGMRQGLASRNSGPSPCNGAASSRGSKQEETPSPLCHRCHYVTGLSDGVSFLPDLLSISSSFPCPGAPLHDHSMPAGKPVACLPGWGGQPSPLRGAGTPQTESAGLGCDLLQQRFASVPGPKENHLEDLVRQTLALQG